MKRLFGLAWSLILLGCDAVAPHLGGHHPAVVSPVCSRSSDTASYLGRLGCREDWTVLQGPPMNASHGQATAVKFIFSLESGRLWFTNSSKYPLHWDFAQKVIGIDPETYSRWVNEYSEKPGRRFVLGTLTRYEGSNLWTLQLFPGDDLSNPRLDRVFRAIADSAWFGPALRYLPANDASAARARELGIALTSFEQVYQGQNFQSLNPGVAYGTLVKVAHDALGAGELSPRAIVLTDGLTNDLPLVAGVITTAFQTPLSHINVLSRNRGTPNMALRDAWSDTAWSSKQGKLVRLEVTLDSFSLREASLQEAQTYWDTHGPPIAPALPLDTTSGLVMGVDLDHGDLPRVGAKAANFGELIKLAARSQGAWRVPEGGFAIPMAAYLEHLRRNRLDTAVERLLSDTLVRTNAAWRKTALEGLQARILAAQVDPELVVAVTAAIRANGKYTRMRFRSSTNAEDLPEFNGAGLYSSFTGDPDDAKKPVSDAIRKVWASLWNLRAFEEREYFRIDQRRVAMGILVHRGFPDEGANGVAITCNIYMPNYIGYVINAQVGEVSVVSPPEGVVTEQQIYYPFDPGYLGEPSLELISRSSLTGGAPVLNALETVHLGNALEQVQARFCRLLAPQRQQWIDYGMDVEFKLDGPDRILYLKQARPLP